MVARRGGVNSFQVKVETEDEAKAVEGAEKRAQVVIENRGRKQMEYGSAEEKSCQSNQKTGDAIGFINRSISLGRYGAVEKLAGNGFHEKKLKEGK